MLNLNVVQNDLARYDNLPKPLKVIIITLTIFGIAIFICHAFDWRILGWVLRDGRYYYPIYACFTTCVFLTLPMRKTERYKTKIPWYDMVFAALVFGICVYFTIEAGTIMRYGWRSPVFVGDIILATILSVLALEGGRRMAGIPFTIICLLVGVYPIFADYMPGFLWGFGFSFRDLIAAAAFGKQGMLGLPAEVIGEILIGFLIFAGMMLASGAGNFFLNFALALLGRFRGGPAKVAVLSSGFFGSITGAPMANIVATGSLTIPAMKRLGYPPHYAGAIEAVASTGGVIMPPVMGTIAFIMSIITEIPYSFIISAAIIPAILYYYGLLVQVDAYAAKAGLKGLHREDIPSLLKTLKGGWQFIAALALLVFGLIGAEWGALAPIYASGLLFLLSFTSRETMMTPRRFVGALATIGNLITYTVAVLLPMGFIMLGLNVTGTLTALTGQIALLGGSNVAIALLIAVAVCYIFGMAGITLIPYIVLAVIAIPPLVVTTGLNQLALHLFLMYYLLTAWLTPPVAISAFVAAALAGAPPMKTGWLSMRLAVVLYFIPFFFVFNPALILEGPIWETLYLFALCLLGIWILASGLEGYLAKLGRLSLWERPLFIVGGFLIAFPEWKTTIIGAALTAMVIAITLIRKKNSSTIKASEFELHGNN
jgi:TRAP transporter 4TM/12TM fusion protein